MNAVVVVVLFGIMQGLRSFGGGAPAASIGTSVALGYLLLTGYFVGRMFASIRLPKLTGYIIAGIVVGPAALNLVNERMVGNLQVVNGMAVALIALTAGLELDLRSMRPLLRTIGWITLIGVLGTAILLALTVFGIRSWLPFLAGRGLAETVAVASVLGVVIVAQSPAVVVALNNEMKAEGPVSRTVLGVVVIADLMVILLFAGVSTVAKSILGTGGDAWATVGAVAWETGGSLVIGAALGYLLSIYVDKVRGGSALFVLVLMFIVAEVGRRLHFDPLLVALAMGMLVRNSTACADAVLRMIEDSSLPVYVLFFTVAGATLHLDALAAVWPPAVLLVLVRGLGLFVGSRLGSRFAGAEPGIQRYAGFGLLPQAGLALALSLLFAKVFPEFGAEAGALTLSIVAINEVLAPATYRMALVRSGEAGRRAEAAPAESVDGIPEART